jgi:two-component system NtrC family sensor kinase
MNRQKEEPKDPRLPPELAGTRLPRYRRLRRNIVAITCLVALAPLVILTTINYTQDRQAYKVESRFAISRILSNTKRTMEFVIEERLSALNLIIKEKSYAELSSDSALALALQHFKDSFGGFIDLGLINSSGQQLFYTGPYNLKNRNYADQDWYHEVVLRGLYVSDVFMGHREFPHFVVAVKHDLGRGDLYILRATLDMDLINQQIQSLNLDRHTDAFLINHDGVLQTASIFYGGVLDTASLSVPTVVRSREIINEYAEAGQDVTSGYAYIEGTPFILMAITRQENPFYHWLSHRSDVLWFLLVSSVLILGVILYGSSRMARQLREADLRRVRAFHNIEYTNKMATIGRMAAGVAHEINNPMAIINEKAGLIRDLAQFSDDFQQKEKTIGLVDSILKSVDRCSQVTRRLLGFARRMEVRSETINLQDLVREVVGFQRTEVLHRNIEVTYDFPDTLPPIESDRGQLQQVLLNILTNALAAVDNGGQIAIAGARHDPGMVRVSITDNGTGISRENLSHIFEPFYSTKGEFGTGLGLSITRDITEKLGGKIEVESELGKGTRFDIILPLKKTEFGE